jgi:peptide/nickel transport system substrate-binding protein
MPKPRSAAVSLMQSASAPDPHTFVVQWGSTYVNAGREGPGTVIPRHLLEEMYRQDKTSLITSPLLTTEFVGLGPYKLARWERGVLLEFTRFDDYYQGRPSLDTVVVRIIPDANTMVTNILSVAVDVLLPTGVDLEAALEVKRRWAGTGNEVRADNTGRLRQMEIQGRAEFARPRNGLPVTGVRQGLYRAIDRATLVDVITEGQAPVADSWIPPTHALRSQLEASIPDFSYNVVRAQELFTQAGWVRGADGVMVHQPSGERFEIEIWGRQGDGSEREMNVIADNWKAVGAQVTLYTVPAARLGDREFGTTYPGMHIVNPSGDAFYENRLHSALVANPANRYTGRNRSGYANPQVDRLLDQLQVTIGQTERVNLHRQLLQEQMGDVALMPLYWEVVPVLMLKGVRGPKAVRNEATHNIFEWDKV